MIGGRGSGLAGICVALTLAVAFAPGIAASDHMVRAMGQMHRAQSILTLCLVLFVCFAIRPMGLSYKSKIFGVSLGLAAMAMNYLAQSAWLSHDYRMHTVNDLVNAVVLCATLVIWVAYFAMPEPRRREVMLPASSVFVRLNRMGLVWFG